LQNIENITTLLASCAVAAGLVAGETDSTCCPT